ncbi:hypothetical protein BD289DRAFT_261707 [Coniella lustricola]|uniref:Cyanovirin-N domain-containing protein n=1 Tax=Coniella lustricola TaxID=2025994 RepID=A0A2T3A7S7_9PEZI|nr:hypothetical protein BD289DRAFT_261707 [Coniella lustricola]
MICFSRSRGPLPAVVFLVLSVVRTVFAGEFTSTCANYYLGNGVSDSTGELFIEAWCHKWSDPAEPPAGGICTRLTLAECFKNDNGQLRALNEAEQQQQPQESLAATCDIESCAIRGDAWDGPIMTCYCLDLENEWQLASVNLNDHVGNYDGHLRCNAVTAPETCLDPSSPGSGSSSELR